MIITATPVHYPTAEAAREAHAHGWNLRCNLCGTFGAGWVPGQRPGWGALAMCPTHRQDLDDELRRHEYAIGELRRINFEQKPTTRPAVDIY